MSYIYLFDHCITKQITNTKLRKMKKLFYLFVALAFIASANAQTIGIGTTTPNTNAVLDIFSNNKGILIPRVGDTGIITSPLEGLIIYNKNTKTPYYHDGTRWLSLGGRLPSGVATSTDRMTYQITGGAFNTAELEFLAASVGVSNPSPTPGGIPSASSYNLMKVDDINSKHFNMATFLGTHFASIEFKYYATGASVPYASIRLKDIYIESYQTSLSAGGGSLTESISIAYDNYGFKDWVNGVEFGYSTITRTVTVY